MELKKVLLPDWESIYPENMWMSSFKTTYQRITITCSPQPEFTGVVKAGLLVSVLSAGYISGKVYEILERELENFVKEKIEGIKIPGFDLKDFKLELDL